MSSLSFTTRILLAIFLAMTAFGGVPNPHRRRIDGEETSQQVLTEPNTDQFLSSFLSNIPDPAKSDPIEKISPYTTVSDPVPVPKSSVQNIEPRTDIVTGGIGTFAAVIGGAVARFLAFLFKKKLIIAAIIVGILASLGLTATVSKDLVNVAKDVVAEHRLQKAVDGQVDDRMDPIQIAEETESLFSWILNMFNLTSWFGTGGNDANYSVTKEKSNEISLDSVVQSSEELISAGLPELGNKDLLGNTMGTTDDDATKDWIEENNVVNPFTVSELESPNVDKGVMELEVSNPDYSLTVGVSSSPNEDVIESVENEDLRNGRKAGDIKRRIEVDSGMGEVNRVTDLDDLAESDQMTNTAFSTLAIQSLANEEASIIDPVIEEDASNPEVFENKQRIKDVVSNDQFDNDQISVGKVISMSGKAVLGNGETTNVGVIEEMEKHRAGDLDSEYLENEVLPEVFVKSRATIEIASAMDQNHGGIGIKENEKGGVSMVDSNKIQASKFGPTNKVIDSGALLPTPSDQTRNLGDYSWLSDQSASRDILAVGDETHAAFEPVLPVRKDPIVLKLMSNVDGGVGGSYVDEDEDANHVGVTDGYRDLLATLRSVELEFEHTTKPSGYEEEIAR